MAWSVSPISASNETECDSILAPFPGLAFVPSNAFDYAGIIPIPNLSAHALPEKAIQDRSACHISFPSHATTEYNAHHPLPNYSSPHAALLLPRLFRITAHNLDLVRGHSVLIIQLKVDVLDQKRPYFVAEAISIKMPLHLSAIAPLPETSF